MRRDIQQVDSNTICISNCHQILYTGNASNSLCPPLSNMEIESYYHYKNKNTSSFQIQTIIKPIILCSNFVMSSGSNVSTDSVKVYYFCI